MKLLLFPCVSCFGGVSSSFFWVCLSDIGAVSIELIVFSFDFLKVQKSSGVKVQPLAPSCDFFQVDHYFLV